MGDAIITRRAGGEDNSVNKLIATFWVLFTAGNTEQYASSATYRFVSVDSDYFTYNDSTAKLTARQAMSVKIMPIARGVHNSSGQAKTITYKIYKNSSSVVSQSSIANNPSTLNDSATTVSLASGNTLTISVTGSRSGTAATEAGFFVELR